MKNRSATSRIDDQIQHERRRALRALLMRPMLRASGSGPDAEVFNLVRTHAAWLREWYGKQLGWTLHVDAELARLGKTPAEPMDPTRPARDPVHGTPFTRTRYVLLCLSLACLEKGERQTTLGNLATELQASMAEEGAFVRAGLSFDLATRESRRDLVHVILFLLELGVMVRVHGDESQYLAERGDVLYTVHRPAIAAILNIRRGPSSISCAALDDRISALLEEPRPDTEDGWNRRLRIRLARKLVDDPVLYYTSLDPDEKAYLDSQRHFLVEKLEEGTGLVGEIRAEGIALVDEEGELSDIGMPSEGTEGHFTLLIAEHLAARLRESPDAVAGFVELEATARELIGRFGSYWRKSVREQANVERTLLAEAIARLEALRLVAVNSEERTVTPLPAIARYSVEAAPSINKEF